MVLEADLHEEVGHGIVFLKVGVFFPIDSVVWAILLYLWLSVLAFGVFTKFRVYLVITQGHVQLKIL